MLNIVVMSRWRHTGECRVADKGHGVRSLTHLKGGTMTIGQKQAAGFGVVLGLMALMAAINYWGLSKLNSVNESKDLRVEQMATIKEGQLLTVEKYQVIADTVINREVEKAKGDYKELQARRAENQTLSREAVDTPEEIALLERMAKADAELDELYFSKVAPEVVWENQGVLRQMDGKADELIARSEEIGQKLRGSLQNEFDEALARVNSALLKRRASDLHAVDMYLFWMIKQYQAMADTIINRTPEAIEGFKRAAEQTEHYQALLEKAVDTPAEREWIRQVDALDAEFDAIYNEQVMPTVARLNENRLQTFDGLADEKVAEVSGLTGQIIESVKGELKEASDEFASTQRVVTTLSVFITLAGIAAASILAFLIARAIVSSLSRAAETLNMSAGYVADASGQVSSSSQTLAQGAAEQAASLEETSASLQQISAMTARNADNAREVSALAQGTASKAEEGATAMGEMIASMKAIHDSSGEIEKIIKVIEEIAFQTNLLALNAAVEAARAGESGKGFAVVAEEVRNLAQRATAAAKETAGLIEKSVTRVNNGDETAGRAGKALNEIVDGVRRISELTAEIAAASDEQSRGVEQVSQAVTNMDKVTQTNASNAEESAAASEELSGQAENMRTVVEDLMHMVYGANGHNGNGHNGNGHKKGFTLATARKALPKWSRPSEVVEVQSAPVN